jgi:hypothetical protein
VRKCVRKINRKKRGTQTQKTPPEKQKLDFQNNIEKDKRKRKERKEIKIKALGLGERFSPTVALPTNFGQPVSRR